VYFVTGAAGFIGRPLVDRLLASGAAVRCLRRPGSPIPLPAGASPAFADLLDSEALSTAVSGCDTILHLAGTAHDLGPVHDEEFHRVNVDGTASLISAAERMGVSGFVYVSSVKAMGEGGDQCLDETAAAAPVSPYGFSKLQAERLVLETGARSGMRTSVLRLPLVYGSGLKGNLRTMLDAVRNGSFPPPPRVLNRRSLASTEDVVNAILLAGSNPAAAGRTYIVTDGVTYSTRDIYDAMRAALGLSPTRWAVPLWALKGAARAGDAIVRVTRRRAPFSTAEFEKLFGSACYLNQRIRDELGFVPATTLGDFLLRQGSLESHP
jgi:UDP-glucose 4-epimerase